MKSALSNPDGNNTFNIYGHELAPLLGGLKTIAGKFVVNNTVPRDNLKLSDSILTCVGAILRHEQPWKYQDEVDKYDIIICVFFNVTLFKNNYSRK